MFAWIDNDTMCIMLMVRMHLHDVDNCKIGVGDDKLHVHGVGDKLHVHDVGDKAPSMHTTKQRPVPPLLPPPCTWGVHAMLVPLIARPVKVRDPTSYMRRQIPRDNISPTSM